jgi:hypothetical protein
LMRSVSSILRILSSFDTSTSVMAVIMPGRLTSLVRLVCGCVHNRCGKGVGGLREGEGKGGKSSGVESGT